MMNKLDPHTLFSIFEQGDEQIYKEYGMEDTLNNPFVLMGMVLKGLENYSLMDLMYIRHYGEGYKKLQSVIKYKYFNKLFGYLSRIDTTKYTTVYRIGESFEKLSVDSALNTLLRYYEELEEYEKCAIIKKCVDLLAEGEAKRELSLI